MEFDGEQINSENLILFLAIFAKRLFVTLLCTLGKCCYWCRREIPPLDLNDCEKGEQCFQLSIKMISIINKNVNHFTASLCERKKKAKKLCIEELQLFLLRP